MNDDTRTTPEQAALASRLRNAVRSESVPPFLEARVRAAIRGSERPQPHGWAKWSMAGVALAVVAAAGISYELGHLRFTEASQESYLVKVSNQAASIMRVGLGDHIHCAYFRKFPKQAPAAGEFLRGLGKRYSPLLPIVDKNVPAGTKIADAHHCLHRGRKFVHLTMRGDSHLVSLVIARKQDGESFEIEGLMPALVQSGLPVYKATAQKFEIASFETGGHLVYLVSDLPAEQNQERLLAMAPAIRDLLNQAEKL